MYPNTDLHIAGRWRSGAESRTLPVLNPATGETIGQCAVATTADLDEALEAAARAFPQWRSVAPFERCKRMRKAADLLRERVDAIARVMTMEQGKPLAEAKVETLAAADIIDWFAEEGEARLWPCDPRPRRRRAAGRGEGARRPRGVLHALELPDQPGGAQDLGGALHRLHRDPEGAGGHPGELRRTGPRLPRCRHSRRRPVPRLRRSGGDLGLSHPAPRDPQDLVHRLDRGGQEARGLGRRAHEARDDGTRRARPGHRVRRCRRGEGGLGPGAVEVPQRGPSLRVADALPRPRFGVRPVRPGLQRLRQGREGGRRARPRDQDGAADPQPPARCHRIPDRRRRVGRGHPAARAASASATGATSSSRRSSPRCRCRRG